MKPKHQEAFLKLASEITQNGSIRGDVFGIELPYEENKTMLRHLAEYGVLGVRTVNEIGWQGYSNRKYYLVWITQIGVLYLTGRIEVDKPCNKEGGGRYSPICKRCGVHHYRESF